MESSLEASTIASDPLIGQTLHGYLSIKALLGEGGMGRVYLATHVEFASKRYAVKVLRRSLTHNPSFQQLFYDEAKHQAKLDHPNIVQMIDYFHVGDQYFLVLQYVDGQPLSELIGKTGGKGLPEKQALKIIKGVLAGLDYAHRAAILHRDVKSSNVLVDREGHARITDFGIAMQAGGAAQGPKGRLMGTPAYMSPEQLRDSAEIDHRSDEYGAGVVLFEALTGRLPFTGDSFEAVQAQQIEHPSPNPRHFNPAIRKGVAQAVRRALRNAPAERFPGCAQFLRKLEDLDKQWRKYAVLVSACIVLATGIYIAKSMIIDRQAIQNLLVDGAHVYNVLCKEAQVLDKNRSLRRVAAIEGFSDEVDMFDKRISENEYNVKTVASSYGQLLGRLSTFNQWSVRSVFDTPDTDTYTAVVRPQMRDDYSRYLHTGEVPTPAAMSGQCAKLGW